MLSLASSCSSADGPCYPSEVVTTDGQVTLEKTYQYSGSGLLLVTEEQSSSSVDLIRETFEYDDRDNLVLIERETNGEPTRTESFGYDDDSNQTSWKVTYGPDSDLFTAWVAVYDERRNMIQQDWSNEDGSGRRITQEFDEDNRLMTRQQFGPTDASPYYTASYFYEDALLVRIEAEVDWEDRYETVETFAHDPQGRVVEHCLPQFFDRSQTTCHYSHYDDETGIVTEESDTSTDGIIDYRTVLAFDGDLLMSQSYDENADGEFETITSFQYDSRGNRVGEEAASMDGRRRAIETRYRCF